MGVLLPLGRLVRRRWALMRSLYMPSSVIAGILGLLLGSSVLGAIADQIAAESVFFHIL